MRIILASASPRRKELLGRIFVDFEIIPADVNEDTEIDNPQEAVIEVALRKADKVSEGDALVISADTTVWLDRFYNKPRDFHEAVQMLTELSGRRHHVYTGVCVRQGSKCVTFCEVSYVTFRKLTDREIADYVNTYEPYDKAGAYGIQHGEIIESYEGDLDNIIGLPVERLREVLRDWES